MPYQRIATSLTALMILACGWAKPSAAEELWTVRGGRTVVTLDARLLEELGLQVIMADSVSSEDSQPEATGREDVDSGITFTIDADSTLTFAVENGAVGEFLGGRVFHTRGLSIAKAGSAVTLDYLMISQLRDVTPSMDWVIEAPTAGGGALLLRRVKTGFNHLSEALIIHSPEVYLSPAAAAALGDPELSGVVLGSVTTHAIAEWVGGDEPEPVPPEPPERGGPRAGGPDVTFCQLYNFGQWGREADIVGLSEATTSWNVGDEVLMWHGRPSEDHPFIIMDMFRLETVDGSERFEQIGQSWIKHGFCALDSSQCGGSCPPTGCGTLGLNCTDTYTAGLNANQNGLGPRYEVNPWTGVWEHDGSHFDVYGYSHSHDGIEHRLQVHDADLDPAQHPDASYYGSSLYICLDDVEVMNSTAWKPVAVSGSPGGSWSLVMSGAGERPEKGFADTAWAGARKTLLAQEIPVIEFVSPDGRCVLSSKTTDLGGGQWHYEYALYNIDMDRKVGSFSIPVTPGTIVTNIAFHAVEHHDEEVAGYSNDPWSVDTSGGAITWSTADNPVRWGTLYNFRFDANVPPHAEDVTVTLGLFETGTPDVVTGATFGPEQGPPDCNGNGIPDDCDVDCGEPGGECDVPDCGGSDDCNDNGVPDECDPEYLDIGLFVGQLLAESQDPVLVCMFDQNGDATLDGTDVQGFVDRLLSP